MREYPIIDLVATGARIRELKILNHLRVQDISDYMGFESVQSVYKWMRGESLPTVDNLYALSRLFGTSMDNILIEKKGDASPLVPFFGAFLYVLLRNYASYRLNQRFISFS